MRGERDAGESDAPPSSNRGGKREVKLPHHHHYHHPPGPLVAIKNLTREKGGLKKKKVGKNLAVRMGSGWY